MAEEVWAAERPKRFLAAPIAVGTIDQALLSALQVKHAHLRSVCLDRALLVVDEVHASDPYMREILAHLLDGHTTRGGYSALLSATLGESARERLLRKPRVSVEDAIARPYPLLSTRGAERPQLGTGRTKSVRLELFEGLQVLQPVCDRLVQALEHGARVLAVCNTVARANALLRAIEGEDRIPREQMFGVGGVNCPHHGRFARPDREILDAEISKRLGPGSPAGPLLVVGTQTLEQSLDIDADWLLTDPCPMDVLLQRFGRLHRHPRAQRPSLFETPQATMLIPEGGDFSQYVSRKQGEGRGPAGIGRVYADMRILQCTVDALRAQADITIPRDNRSLVEAATHPDSLAQLSGAAWTAHTQYLTGTLIAQLRQAELGRLEELPFGECQYPSKDDGPVATRLGAGSYTLRLPRTMTSPLGQAIDEVAIPFHMLPKLDDGAVPSTKLLEVDALTPTPEGFDLTVQHKSYRYTRFGLETGDA
jgi:CRISPR-associated endonuclease/helicase Cas3